MANCQNNIRYGRSVNMYQQRSSCMNQRQLQGCRDTGRCAAEQRETERHAAEHREAERREAECRERERREAECRGEKPCGCKHEDPLAGMPLAMAYVPWQEWREIYDVCEGFQRGTIFKELDKPFHGRGGCNR